MVEYDKMARMITVSMLLLDDFVLWRGELYKVIEKVFDNCRKVNEN